MPEQYRKKKRVTGPSKNEEKIERNRQADFLAGRSNSLSARFPDVTSLRVTLAFFGPQGQSYGEEKRTFNPNDPCVFSVPCPGRCGVGAFDLAGKLADVLAAHEPTSKATGICQEPLYAGAAARCECRLECSIDASYRA